MVSKQLWPICAICNKLVENLKAYDDFRTNEVMLTAECHGAVDECRVNPCDLVFNTVERGYAFATRKLEPIVENKLKDKSK